MDHILFIEEIQKKFREAFTRRGKIIQESPVDYYLLAATVKGVRFTESILLLLRSGLVNESLPILESFLEHTVNMRWIMERETPVRLNKYLSDLKQASFGGFWTRLSLINRMKEIGLEQAYYDYLLKYIYSFTHIDPNSLGWFELSGPSDTRRSPQISPAAVSSVTAYLLGHMARALSVRYGTAFHFYQEIWDRLRKDREERTQYKRTVFPGPAQEKK